MLTLDEANDLCTAARATAADQGLAMSFAVMDAGGHLLAFARMDGAPWVSADVAQGKAWTAAAYGVPSDAQKEKMAPMPNFAGAITAMTHGRFTPQTGAVPVYRDGHAARRAGRQRRHRRRGRGRLQRGRHRDGVLDQRLTR